MFEKSLDRRAFLALSGAAATVAAATVSIAYADEAPKDGDAPAAAVEAVVDSDWRQAPEPVPADQISETVTADYVVIGMGHAGTSCARTLAEAGASVVAIEAQVEDVFSAFGEDFGHIGSQWLADQGVEPADPVEFFNNWMLNAQNLANPSLVMAYAQNCGETFDWWVEGLGEEFMSHVTLDFWPRPDDAIYEIGGQKFYSGTPQFIEEGYAMTQVVKTFHGLYRQAGGRLDYGVTADQLVKDESGRVTGVVAKNAEGAYVEYDGSKAVILAAGDFGGNSAMVKELCVQIADAIPEGTMWVNMGRDGSGIRMGLWAGGHLEPRGLATMGGDTCHPGIVNQGMTGVWFNYVGERFCNEFFGDTIWTGRTVFQQNLDTVYCLYDNKLMGQLGFNIPAHNRFDPTDPAEVSALQDILDSAVAAGSEGLATWNGMVYAADTLEGVADAAGMSPEVKETFLAQVERYNGMCAAGVDEDFGKDARVLWALDTAPYYLVVCPAPMVAFFLVTVGGLSVDGHMRVLDEAQLPIEGLYACGNCSGRRFGSAYFSPTAGVSLGMANTLGRVLGKELLEA